MGFGVSEKVMQGAVAVVGGPCDGFKEEALKFALMRPSSSCKRALPGRGLRDKEK
jgi:selenophosphate synthase